MGDTGESKHEIHSQLRGTYRVNPENIVEQANEFFEVNQEVGWLAEQLEEWLKKQKS